MKIKTIPFWVFLFVSTQALSQNLYLNHSDFKIYFDQTYDFFYMEKAKVKSWSYNSAELTNIKNEVNTLLNNKANVVQFESKSGIEKYQYDANDSKWVFLADKLSDTELAKRILDKAKMKDYRVFVYDNGIVKWKLSLNDTLIEKINGTFQKTDTKTNTTSNFQIANLNSVLIKGIKLNSFWDLTITNNFGESSYYYMKDGVWVKNGLEQDQNDLLKTIVNQDATFDVKFIPPEPSINWSFLSNDLILVRLNEKINEVTYQTKVEVKVGEEIKPKYTILDKENDVSLLIANEKIKSVLNGNIESLSITSNDDKKILYQKINDNWKVIGKDDTNLSPDDLIKKILNFSSTKEVTVKLRSITEVSDLKLKRLKIFTVRLNKTTNFYTKGIDKKELIKMKNVNHYTTVNLNSASISIRDGIIYDVRIKDDNGNTYSNNKQFYSIYLLHSDKKNLVLTDKNGNIITLRESFENWVNPSTFPKTSDTTINLVNTDSIYTISNKRALHSFVDFRVYTDLLALLNQQNNGIAQIEGTAKIFINQTNITDVNLYFIRFVEPYMRFAKLSSGVQNEVNIIHTDTNNTLIGHPLKLLQQSFFQYGIDLNLLYFNKFDNSIKFSVNYRGEVNNVLANKITASDTTISDAYYRSIYHGPGVYFNFNNDKAFGFNFGFEALTQHVAGDPDFKEYKIPDEETVHGFRNNNQWLTVGRLTSEIYYSPNFKDSWFLRAIIVDDFTSSDGDFVQLQLGWKKDLELPSKN